MTLARGASSSTSLSADDPVLEHDEAVPSGEFLSTMMIFEFPARTPGTIARGQGGWLNFVEGRTITESLAGPPAIGKHDGKR